MSVIEIETPWSVLKVSPIRELVRECEVEIIAEAVKEYREAVAEIGQSEETMNRYFVPNWPREKLRRRPVNRFRFDEDVELPFFLDFCLGYEPCEKYAYLHRGFVKPGWYVRKLNPIELKYVEIAYVPTFTYEGARHTMGAEENEWCRVFYATKDFVVSCYVTTDEMTLVEQDRTAEYYGDESPICEGPSVLKRLERKVKRARQLLPTMRKPDADDELLDEAILFKNELVKVRDMDRARNRFIYAHGRILECQEEDCEGYASCPCNRCVFHCKQERGCVVSPKDYEAAQRDRNPVHVVKNLRKKKSGRRPSRDGFSAETERREEEAWNRIVNEGRAHGWFEDFKFSDFKPFENFKPFEGFKPIPSSFEHTFNVNVNLPFLKPLFEMLENVNKTIPWKRIFKDFAFMCAHIYASKNRATDTIAVIHFISQLPVAENLVSSLLAKVPGWFGCNAQSAGVEGLFVPLLTLIGVVISTLGIGKLPNDKSISDFIMRLSKIGSCIKSLEVMKDYIKPSAEALIDYVRVNFFGYSSTNMNAWKSYDDYCDEIQNLNNSGFEERLKTEKNLIIQIDDLLIRGDNLMKTLDQLKIPATQRSRFNSAYAWLGRMRNEAACCSAGKHIPRIPPVIFHFVGKTGVGKSEATSLLNARLLTKLGHTDESDLYTKVYYRDCGQERFDGYNSGVVGVVVDDFGSRVDTAANPSSEPFEVIRMQNSAVWQLPMASLSEKGSTFFRAKYVIWTSNQATFKFESITNPEAVLRRVTLKFLQYPRPEFATCKLIGKENVVTLDHFKVAEAAKTNPDIYDDVWLFDLVDSQADATPADADNGGMKVVKAGLSFNEAAEMCENALMRAQDVGQKKLDHTAAYFRKCVENQGKAHGGSYFFGMFGSDEKEDITEWEHVDPWKTGSSFIFEGELVSPTLRPDSEFAGDRREEYEQYYMKNCFRVKGGKKVRTRFVRAYHQAMSQVMLAKETGMEEKDRIELFGRVMASYNVPVIRVQVCTNCRFSGFWKKFTEYQLAFSGWRAKQWNKIPESWQPTINMAYELCIESLLSFLAIFVMTCTTAVFLQIAAWLFPSLDPERQRLMTLYEDIIFDCMCYDPIPHEYELMRDNLEFKLGLTEKHREMTVAEVERKFRTTARELRERFEGQCAESFQEKTQGAARRNVESHQDKTNGVVRKNVESHQERTPGRVVKNVEGCAEATNDQNASEIVWKVKRNIYGVQVISETGNYFVGNLLFVTGKIAITNRHIYKLIKGRTIRLFNQASQRGTVVTAEQTEEMSVAEITEGLHQRKDVVMIEMPRHMMVHADLTQYFMTREDFCRHSQLASVCVTGYSSDLGLSHRYTDKCQAIDRIDFKLTENDSEQTQVREWYRYGIHSRPGDCGGVAIAHDPSTNRKIIGIHMAGYDSEGYFGVAVAVHQDLLKALREKLVLKNAESGLDGTFALEGERTDKSFGDFVNYGQAMAKGGCATSVIRPGPVHGIIAEPKTAPAKLRPFYKDGVLIDPLEMARVKADTPNVPVEDKTLKQCSEHYSNMIMDLKKDRTDDKVLSWEEAIMGTEDHYYSPVKRNTSPGYGWESKGTGKQPWLGSGENYITDHPDVIRKRDEMIERGMKGQRVSTVFQDTLKDERRPLDRVEKGKTRLFAAGEMVFSILFRQYFAGFTAHIMRNCVFSEVAVGINTFGEMWSTLANRMQEVGPDVVAGDFSNYDGTLCSAIIWEILDVIERFYENSTEEERMMRRALWCELANSVHATVPFDGTQFGKIAYLYQWSHSNPSGNPITSVLNSVYNSIATRYVYKICARRYCPQMVGLNNFTKHVRHISYGDDNVTNISPEIIDWFNQLTITEAYTELGMVYTDEAKSEELVRARKIHEIAFLKRKFRWDVEQGRWRCPHSLDVITEMAMWVKRGANVYELTAEVLEEAMHELAQHDRETFNKFLPNFLEARKKVVQYWPCTFLTYDEYAEVDMSRMGWMSVSDVRAEREVDRLFV